MAKEKLISCAIAAQRLGFSPDYVRRLCADGKIKAEKITKDWLMSESAIKNIKRQRKVKIAKES